MEDEIKRFLRGISLKNSERKARQLVAEHFDGILTSNSRYVKIGDMEFRIEKDADAPEGWVVQKMDWGIGNDWRFSKPY